MTDRSQAFMNAIWEHRNNGADTEEKLVSIILKLAAENVRFYNAQNDMIVLDKTDLLQLAEELSQ
jgi:homogentisate 1,2-dioxygenase